MRSEQWGIRVRGRGQELGVRGKDEGCGKGASRRDAPDPRPMPYFLVLASIALRPSSRHLLQVRPERRIRYGDTRGISDVSHPVGGKSGHREGHRHAVIAVAFNSRARES